MKAVLNASVSGGIRAKLSAIPTQSVSARLSCNVCTVSIGRAYDGSYTITPAVDAQTMQTRGKRMTDNVEIKAIQTYEVSNQQGGVTFIIADPNL